MASARVPAESAVPLIHAVYNLPLGGVGHCLHIVLDDGNLDNDSIDWCLAKPDICPTCRTCAETLKTLSMTARRKARRLALYPHRFLPPEPN